VPCLRNHLWVSQLVPPESHLPLGYFFDDTSYGQNQSRDEHALRITYGGFAAGSSGCRSTATSHTLGGFSVVTDAAMVDADNGKS
jgi:hypothetical protein